MNRDIIWHHSKANSLHIQRTLDFTIYFYSEWRFGGSSTSCLIRERAENGGMDFNFEFRQTSVWAVSSWATLLIFRNLSLHLWSGVIHFLQGHCENVETCKTHCRCSDVTSLPLLTRSSHYFVKGVVSTWLGLRRLVLQWIAWFFDTNVSASRAWVIVLLPWTSFGTGSYPPHMKVKTTEQPSVPQL